MGASPLAIKERLGHADVLTTFRKYGHLFQGVQERLTAQLEEAHRQAVGLHAGRPGHRTGRSPRVGAAVTRLLPTRGEEPPDDTVVIIRGRRDG